MAGVVYLVRDLVFGSKIAEAAAHLGVEVASARDADGLLTMARGARLVIVDLRDADGMRALGCGTVLAKGAFASGLPALLRRVAGGD